MLGAKIELPALHLRDVTFTVETSGDDSIMIIISGKSQYDSSGNNTEVALFNSEKYPNTVRVLRELRDAMIDDGGEILIGSVKLGPENRL